jgi:hypothetical protein
MTRRRESEVPSVASTPRACAESVGTLAMSAQLPPPPGTGTLAGAVGTLAMPRTRKTRESPNLSTGLLRGNY